MTTGVAAGRLGPLTAELRQQEPLVHNINNRVMRTGTAEAITASGATHMTIDSPSEASEVAGLAQSLVINTGTPDPDWRQAAGDAAQRAAERNIGWLLDPIAAGVTPRRTALNTELLGMGPTVIKGNASEIMAMAGEGSGGHGPDSVHAASTATGAAEDLARRHGVIAVVSGASDTVSDGITTAQVTNGAPVMGRMVGSGCMLGAVIGCYLATGEQPFVAALAGLAHFNVSGEIAAANSAGPGSLYPALLDAIDEERGDRLATRAAISIAR